MNAAALGDSDIVGNVSTVQWLQPFLENWILSVCSPTAWARAKVEEVDHGVDPNSVQESLLRMGAVHPLIQHLQHQFSDPPLDWRGLRRRVRYPEAHFVSLIISPKSYFCLYISKLSQSNSAFTFQNCKFNCFRCSLVHMS